jgi:hypothetical protein
MKAPGTPIDVRLPERPPDFTQPGWRALLEVLVVEADRQRPRWREDLEQ